MPKMHLEGDNRQKGSKPVHAEDGGDQQQQQNAIAPFYIDPVGEKWRFLTKLAVPLNAEELKQFCHKFHCTRRLDARKFNNKRAHFYCKRQPKCKFRCTMSIRDGIVYSRFEHNHPMEEVEQREGI